MSHNTSRSIHSSKCLAAILFFFCLALKPSLFAQDQRISQMVHTSWTGRDGAPQAITALAQTPDGTLWIGTQGGLFSFDGVKFEAFGQKTGSSALSAKTIRFLFVSKKGDLWVFPFHGAPIRIHQGETRNYDRVDGEHLDVLGRAQEDSSGTIWAVLNNRHIVRLGSDDIWHQVPDPTKTIGHIAELFIDSSDTEWVIDTNLLYRRPAGLADFVATNVYVYGQARIVESQDRTLWVIGQGPGPADAVNLQHIDETGNRLFAPRVKGDISDILVSSDDSLWVSKTDAGLRRLRVREIGRDFSESRAEDPDLFSLKNGITGFGLQALLRDADGNIWVGGMGGLDRFEHANMVPAIADSKVGMWFTCVDTHGDAWAANGSGQLFHIKSGQAAMVKSGGGGTNLFCGADGRVYFEQDSGIFVAHHGKIRHLPLLPGFTGYGDHYLFLGLVEGPDGELIAAVGGTAGHGLWRYDGAKWLRFHPELRLPEVCGMLEVAPNTLYLAFTQPDDRIGKIRMRSLATFPVPIRPVGFTQTSYGVFVYGAKGIAVERPKSFQVFSFLHPEQAMMVTGLVESHNGDLWLTGARGVVRITAAEILAAMGDPTHSVASVNLQEGDFVGPDVFLLFRHSAHIDLSGRLWFSTLNGVVSVDPDHLAARRRPPQLSIRTITADGHPLGANGTFPPDTQYLDINYFGLDLTNPKNVVYKYRLEGLDTIWQSVGSRTEAIYTHLRPGSYRFQVMASNGNDVWTIPVSSAMFRILPHLYERPWVQGLFVLVGVVLVWVGISMRVRYVSSAIRIRAEERADERIRIARDLHDTLLQGVQGLLLSFHVAAEKVPPGHESKPALEKALSRADQIILEGRNRVTRLRSEDLTDAELKSLIEGVAANLNSATAVDFALQRTGGSNALHSHIADEVFCIAREALTNSFRHSAASQIAVELDYQKRAFRMTCRDNGRGFDPAAVRTSRANGHWGLRGMAERAERIGAKFCYTSAPEKGTEVCVTVPARLAYARTSRFRDFFARSTAA